jgi:RNA polymerase sigma-70 factor (sigma-E family)
MADREASFRAFFDQEFRPLRRLAYILTRDWTEAEDLTQDTMLRTYRAWNRISGTSPAAYARTTMLNKHRSMLRRARVEAKYAFARRTSTEVVEERDDRLLIIDALGTLPTSERQVIALRYLEDRPVEEVAALLGVPVGTVKSSTHRAIRKLRETLGSSLDVLLEITDEEVTP